MATKKPMEPLYRFVTKSMNEPNHKIASCYGSETSILTVPKKEIDSPNMRVPLVRKEPTDRIATECLSETNHERVPGGLIEPFHTRVPNSENEPWLKREPMKLSEPPYSIATKKLSAL